MGLFFSCVLVMDFFFRTDKKEPQKRIETAVYRLSMKQLLSKISPSFTGKH